MALIELKCFHCGSLLKFTDRIGLREECPTCKNDVHCCKNCRFYDPKVYNECLEPSAEVVRERDRANHCEYFQAGSAAGGGGKTKEDLMKAAEALFKKKMSGRFLIRAGTVAPPRNVALDFRSWP